MAFTLSDVVSFSLKTAVIVRCSRGSKGWLALLLSERGSALNKICIEVLENSIESEHKNERKEKKLRGSSRSPKSMMRRERKNFSSVCRKNIIDEMKNSLRPYIIRIKTCRCWSRAPSKKKTT